MRILLLNLYYPPDTSATAKMARTVVDALISRHNVTVLCGRPSYDPTERRAWRWYQTEVTERTRIIRTGSTDFARFEMKKRVLNYLSYVALAVPRALFVPCDAVLAMTDPPFCGIAGAFVALLKGKPYVYNIRDMYPDMAVGSSIVEPGLLARIWEKMHRWALRRATRVVVLGEDMRARIVSKGVEPSRLVIVRDGADIFPTNTPLPAPEPEVVRAIRGNFSVVLLHARHLGVAVAPGETDVATLGMLRGFAVFADPDKPADLVSAVRGLVRSAQKLKTMGEAARAAAPDYDRVKELQKFAEVFDQLAAAK